MEMFFELYKSNKLHNTSWPYLARFVGEKFFNVHSQNFNWLPLWSSQEDQLRLPRCPPSWLPPWNSCVCPKPLKHPLTANISVLVKERLYFQQAFCRSCNDRTVRVTVDIHIKCSTSKTLQSTFVLLGPIHSESKIQVNLQYKCFNATNTNVIK